jgi:hypothetical protein
MLKTEGTTNTKKNLKKRYLDKLYATKGKVTYNYHKRKMREGLHEKFDEVWVRLNNNDATLSEWDKALNKWLTMEQI